ncbi:MAG: elongation factor 4, partial [Dehalococcoidia bacterium]|nr:elongation factor 4 [Dehalococcoidia bacterium]
AMIDECRLQFEELLGLSAFDALLVSAKDGAGVPELLEAIVSRIPPPGDEPDAPLSCLIFDSHYDAYRGVIAHVRLFSGSLAPGDKVMVKSTGKTYDVTEVGCFMPQETPARKLVAGDVGFVGAMIRDVADIRVGDTIISPQYPETLAIPGYRRLQPMVFCGLYPINTNEYEKLQMALEKFQLNDSAIVYEKESSAALGHGFRVGFLGMLHMEITIERLRREYEQDLIATMPSVVYKVVTTKGETLMIDNPSKFPKPQEVDRIEEPMIRAHIVLPTEHVGPVMELSNNRRGTLVSMEHPDTRRVILTYDFPLVETIADYYDRLKSVSRGYASMDYEFIGYRRGDLVKVDILVNGDPVDAFSYIATRESAVSRGRALVHKLRKLIPRQQFKVPLQAAISGNVIAREDIAPMRKDVTAKCYGGDITRKRKLLEKQREGKKRMKMVGAVEVPQEAFLSLLKLDE